MIDAIQAAAASSTFGKDVIGSVDDILRTAAILVAGGFGYARFIRGRTLHAALDPALKAELLDVGTGQAMRVIAEIKNTGSFRIVFPLDCAQEIVLECADMAVWDDGVANGEVLWTAGETRLVDLLIEEAHRPANEVLEPGQTVLRERLVPVPLGTWVAYRVTLRVRCRARLIWRTRDSQIWETSMIIKGA